MKTQNRGRSSGLLRKILRSFKKHLLGNHDLPGAGDTLMNKTGNDPHALMGLTV